MTLNLLGKQVSVFWIGITLLILLAAGFGLLSFQFSLPFINHVDEPYYYLGALDLRGLFDLQGYFDGVLSLYRDFSIVVQVVLETFGIQGLSNTIFYMRLISIAAHLLTLLTIGLSARHLANDFAGLIAASLWAFSPLVFANSFLALPDPFVSLFTSLAFYFAIIAFQDEKRLHYLIVSCIFGLLAVLTKYLVVALLPCFLVTLWLIPQNRKAAIRYLVIIMLMIAGTAFWSIFIYGAQISNLPREGGEVLSSGFNNILNFRFIYNNSLTMILINETHLITLVLLLGLLAYGIALWRKTKRVAIAAIIIILITCLGVVALATLHSPSVAEKIRYVLPGSALVTILIALAIVQITYFFPEQWQQKLQLVFSIGLFLTIGIPNFLSISSAITQYRLPEQRVALRQWAETNLEPGWIILERSLTTTFNPFYGGLSGAKWFDWHISNDIMEHSLEEWREDFDIRYAAITTSQLSSLESTQEGQAYLAQMLRLRSFIEVNGGRGPDAVLFRLWRMDNELDVRFGESIALRGYDRINSNYQTGETIPIQLYWQAQQSPDVYYSLFVHLVPSENYEVLAQADGAPGGEVQHTPTWNQPDQIIIGYPYQITIPENVPSGEYHIMLGLYNPETGLRLPINNTTEDAYLLQTIQIE